MNAIFCLHVVGGVTPARGAVPGKVLPGGGE